MHTTGKLRISTGWQRVLLLEPDLARAAAIGRAFEATNLVIDVAATPAEAVELHRECRHAVFVCSGDLAVQPLQALHRADPRLTVIVLGAPPPVTSHSLDGRVASVVQSEDHDELVEAVHRGLRLRRARASLPAVAAAPSRLLLIEDDLDDAAFVETYVREHTGWQVTHALDLRSGLAALQTGGYDYVIVDLTLPDARGVDAVLRVRTLAPEVTLVVLSGLQDDAIAREAIEAGANDYLLKDAVGGPGLMQSLRNARDRRLAESRLRRAANEDRLTGLANRSRFHESLHRSLARVRRAHGEVALLYLDLDGFKAVNDGLGHDAGDVVLVDVARRLRATLREIDLVARLGGDEFAVILEGVAGVDEVVQVARRILSELARPYGEHPAQRAISASIGIALSTAGTGGDELIKAADAAMYEAKRAGRNTFALAACAGPRGRAAAAPVLRYQPQVSGAGRRPAAELMRSRAAGGADGGGAGAELSGAWIIDAACAQLARWRAGGVDVERVAVDVEVGELGPALVEAVVGALARHRLEPHRLELELAEADLVPRLAELAPVLASLEARGVRLALDHVGPTASIAGLYRVPVDVVKLDRAFTGQIGDARARAAMRAVLALCHELGIEVVAEGVDCADQHASLRELGCDRFQGGHVGDPVGPEGFAAAD